MKRKILLGLLLTFFVMAGGCGNKEKLENQEAYRQIGVNRMAEGKYDEAVKAFQSALDQSLAHVGEVEVDTCYYKAEAQYLAGDTTGAEETYHALISYDKKNGKAYYLRGSMYLAEGRIEEALGDFASAVNYGKDDYELYIGIYEKLAADGETSTAQAYLEQALEISGKSAEDFMQRGRVYLLMGETARAKEELEEALKKESDEAAFYMGQLYTMTGEDEQAQKMYETYIKGHEEDKEALKNLAMIYKKQEAYDKAASYLKMALETPEGENSPELRRELVSVCESAGNFAEAKKVMEEYIKDFPDDEQAKREYDFLQTR